MRLRVDIDLDEIDGDTAEEVGRILRFWGGNVTDELLVDGQTHDLYDSSYTRPVGTLSVERRVR